MIWHECPDCGAACGCAMEEECAHVCEPGRLPRAMGEGALEFDIHLAESRWSLATGGAVRDAQGNHVARVSYNGRVWGANDTEIAV